jgi:hypothetical protein
MGTFNDFGEVQVQTRRGDQAMCVRFWSENTRDAAFAVRMRLLARAFHPKARAHEPITTPNRSRSKQRTEVPPMSSGIPKRSCPTNTSALQSDGVNPPISRTPL